MRNHISRIIGVILICVGLFFIGRHYLSGYLIEQNQESVAVGHLTKEQLKANQARGGDFDQTNIRNVNEADVRASRERVKNGYADVNVIGALAIPDAKVKVSVMKGLGEDVLLSGAGTFYDDQKMGEGNYPLASHNMNVVKKGLLLSPIVDKAKVGQRIYLTDLDQIYVYETYFAEPVDPSRVDLVEPTLTSPKDHKPIITLLTCTDDASERMIVQGKLIKKFAFNKADKEIIDLFDVN